MTWSLRSAIRPCSRSSGTSARDAVLMAVPEVVVPVGGNGRHLDNDSPNSEDRPGGAPYRYTGAVWSAKRANRGRDDGGDRVRVGDQCQVRSAAEDGDVGVRAVGHRKLRGGRDDLIIGADEVPGRDGLPRRRS